MEDRIILFGGADQEKQRYNRLWTLHVYKNINLRWSLTDEPPLGTDRPSGECGGSSHSSCFVTVKVICFINFLCTWREWSILTAFTAAQDVQPTLCHWSETTST